MLTIDPAGTEDSCANPYLEPSHPELPWLAPACHSNLSSKVTFPIRPILAFKLNFILKHITSPLTSVLLSSKHLQNLKLYVHVLFTRFVSTVTIVYEEGLCPTHYYIPVPGTVPAR